MNPYSFLKPMTIPTMFYGYQGELEYMLHKVTDRQPTSFFVLGGRSMGKTSLLRQIERRLRLQDMNHLAIDEQQLVIPLYLDMLQLEVTTLNDFYGKIARLLSQYITNAPSSFIVAEHTKTLFQSVKTDPEPFDTLYNALCELAKAAPGLLRVILLIDDLWRVKQDIILALPKNLRALLIEPPLDNIVATVITGSYQEFTWADHSNSPLANLLMLQELHVFDEEQALALINEPTGGHIPMQIAQEVFLETGGHPFLIQYVMSVLCDQEDWTQLTVEDVSQATERFLKERRDFERWVEKLSEADRKIYAAFCQLEQVSSVDDLTRMMLSIPAEGGRSLIVNRLMILDSLRVLSTTGLIRECSDGLYELAGKWPARWFRQMNRTSQYLS